MTNEEQLIDLISRNKSVQFILDHAHELGIPNWYLGAGGIAQTVWNIKHGFDPENGIKDYDLVYYDPSDISYEAEDAVIRKGKELFKSISIPVEIRNQARVHVWYAEHFGLPTPGPVKQYQSAEEAISTWPTTATAIGVRKTDDGFQVCAPFGLEDLFGLSVRANKKKITEKIYQDKVSRWIKIWPKLQIIPW